MGDQRGVCPLKAEVFAKMQRPRTGKEVQKVLGFVNFLRDFIPLYSCVVGPLKGLRSTKKIDNDLWLSSGGKKAFDLAKEILSRVPVLSNLDWSKEFFVETDASQCRQQNPSSFYFWDSYLRITIQKSIHESHNFLNDPIIKS